MVEKQRCFGTGNELYAYYHDQEWGVPVHDDQLLFEMLSLEGAQAGLSWETILKRREGYRQAFYQFDPKRVATMTDVEMEDLMQHPGIIRNRLKIYSVRQNARVFLEIQKQKGSFDVYVWSFVGGTPLYNDWQTLAQIPVSSPHSQALSKDLKKRGMNFVGPTIIYAFIQAVGLVNDHIKSCWCYRQRS